LIQINLGKRRFIYVEFQAARAFAFPLGGLFSEWASAHRSPCRPLGLPFDRDIWGNRAMSDQTPAEQ
jgi:hypothetical protein